MSEAASSPESVRLPQPPMVAGSYNEYLTWQQHAAREWPLDDPIERRHATDFRRSSRAMAAEMLASGHVTPITILISSGGGSVTAGLDIVTQVRHLQSLGIPVHARAVGDAASMAAVIAFACDRLIISRTARIMVHGISSSTNKSDLETISDHLDKIEMQATQIARVILARARRVPGKRHPRLSRLSRVEAVMRDEREIWFSAEEALKYGLADEIGE